MTETGKVESTASVDRTVQVEALRLQQAPDGVAVGIASSFDGILSALLSVPEADVRNAKQTAQPARAEERQREENGPLPQKDVSEASERQPAEPAPAPGREAAMRERDDAPDQSASAPPKKQDAGAAAEDVSSSQETPKQPVAPDPQPAEDAAAPAADASEAAVAPTDAEALAAASAVAVDAQAALTTAPAAVALEADVLPAENATSGAAGLPRQAPLPPQDVQTAEPLLDKTRSAPIQVDPAANAPQSQQTQPQAAQTAAESIIQQGGPNGQSPAQPQPAAQNGASYLSTPEAFVDVKSVVEAKPDALPENAAKVIPASYEGGLVQPTRIAGQDGAATPVSAAVIQAASQDGAASAGADLTNGGTSAEGRDSGVERGTMSADVVPDKGNFVSRLNRSEVAARANQAETIDKIVRSIRVAVERGESRVRILLEPPRLGVVRINLTVKDGVLNASFQTQTAAARHVIAQNLANLKVALEEQGIEVGEFSVSVEGGQDGAQAGENGASREMAAAGGFGRFAESDDEDDEFDVFAEQRRLAVGTAVLDLFA